MSRRRKIPRLRLDRIAFLLFLLWAIVTFINQIKLKRNLEVKRTQYETEIAELQEDIESLEGEIADSDSLQFVEKVAREELGLVKPREIIIIDKNKEKKEGFSFNSLND